MLGHFDDRLLDDHARGIDRDIDLAELPQRFVKQPRDVGGLGQVALHRNRLRTGCLHGSYGFFRGAAGRIAVVVHRDRGRAALGELTGNQPAQVLRTASDYDHLTVERVICHDVLRDIEWGVTV